MRLIHRTLVGLLAALVLGPQLFAGAAVAAPKPKVSITSSSGSVTVGGAVSIGGKVSLRSVGTRVQLQRKAGSSWQVVGQTQVRGNKTYTFRVRPSAGANVYRAKTVRSRALKSAVSKPITIRGVAGGGGAPPSLTPVQQLVFDQTNQERTSRGLPAFTYSEGIEASAQPWAEHMAATGQLDHNPSYSSEIPAGWSRAGENIAMGYPPDGVVAGWMGSPGHRANILGDYTHIGIGYAVAGDGTPYYVQTFGRY